MQPKATQPSTTQLKTTFRNSGTSFFWFQKRGRFLTPKRGDDERERGCTLPFVVPPFWGQKATPFLEPGSVACWRELFSMQVVARGGRLCHAMLCHAVPCHAMLCCAMRRRPAAAKLAVDAHRGPQHTAIVMSRSVPVLKALRHTIPLQKLCFRVRAAVAFVCE